MEKIFFDENCSFKEIVNEIEAIKSQIEGLFAFFSYFNIKEENKFKYNLKRQIYSLKFEEWRKDKIIEYIYGDVDLETLKKLA